ncbi:MAG: carboxypeptidase regulatory-like domain-containing protein, partial [Arenimonas sp.]
MALAVALSASPVLAQNTSSAIGGQITGAEGKPVAGATVTIKHVESGSVSTAVTDASGRYASRGLRVGGPYTITITKDGVTETRENVYLQLAETKSIDASLGGPKVLDTVKVVGVMAGSDVFSADKMGAGTNISGEQLNSFASIQRNLQDYARLDPRLSQTDKERGEISVGGQNSRFNSITIDSVATNDTFGLEANNLPTAKQPISIDAIESVQINISNYDVT